MAESALRIYYHPCQNEIFFGASSARNKVIVKGRRFGLTRGFAQFAIELLLDGVSPLLWVDTINSNIDRYVDRYFIPVLRRLPSETWRWRQQRKELAVGGSVMDFRSAEHPENIEGFGYKVILLNEAGSILRDEYLWHNAIRPMMIDHGASVLAGGTPKGRNLFFRLYQLGISGQEGWKSYHYTSYDNPFVRREEIDLVARDMPEAVRRQEIYAEFLEDEAAVFRGIDRCVCGELEDPRPGEQYVAGLDLAKHVDFTVLTILDSRNHVVFWGRINQKDWPSQKRWIAEHVTRYNHAQTWVDSTGVGDAIFDDLRAAGLSVHPYRFTHESKQRLVEALMLAIETGKVTFPKQLTVLLAELRSFEYTMSAAGPRYSAPEGLHDDAVMSLALAVWGARSGPRPGLFFVPLAGRVEAEERTEAWAF